MANLLWQYNQTAIQEPIVLSPLEQNQESIEYEVTVQHDSNKPITQCAFYISPFSGEYKGTHSPQKDYERVLWLANNYPGFGLSIRQEYSVAGEIDAYSTIRLMDLSRPEETDIFTGETLEIMTGEENGNSLLITSYDPQRKLFLLNGSFFNDVTAQSYKISINKEQFFKSQEGSSFNHAIPLIFGGGVINRFEQAKFKIKLRIPKFAVSAGTFFFDLNMRYTSLDGVQ